MATLLPASAAVTALMLIDRAYSLLGFKAAGEALSADDAEYGRSTLNAMLDGWNTQPMSLLAVRTVVANVSGASAMVGDGMEFDTPRPARIEQGSFARVDGVDHPIRPMNFKAYADIAQKTEAGIPQYAYYEATASAGTVFFYPQPSALTEIHLAVQVQLTEFPDVHTECLLAPGYRKAIEYSLAEELAPGIKEIPMVVMRTAATARRAIRRTNVQVAALDVSL